MSIVAEFGAQQNHENFAGTLGVFSVAVAEDNQLEGDILAVWAGMMKESL